VARLAAKAAQYALVLWVALTVNFLLPRAMPGSPLPYLVGEEVGTLAPERLAEVRARYGLDRSLPVQYLDYLGDVLRGDWGTSFQLGQPVAAAIAERLPWTLLLVGTSLLVSTLFGVVAGALAAWRRGGRFDAASLTGAILVDAMPTFWIGMLLIAVFAVRLGWFPTFGATTPAGPQQGAAWLLDVLRHLVLPATTLTLASLSGTYLVMRSAMQDVLGEDYVRSARAKGVPERRVLMGHAVRNALLPVSTLLFLNLGLLVGGSTIVETVFSYPGVGTLLYEAVLARDYPVLQGAFFVLTLSVVAANVAADALYPWIDPRVRSRTA
jgi:peptide/nickel transport system permease protein